MNWLQKIATGRPTERPTERPTGRPTSHWDWNNPPEEVPKFDWGVTKDTPSVLDSIDEYIEFAEAIARDNGGFLPPLTSVFKRYPRMWYLFHQYPDMFAHIPRRPGSIEETNVDWDEVEDVSQGSNQFGVDFAQYRPELQPEKLLQLLSSLVSSGLLNSTARQIVIDRLGLNGKPPQKISEIAQKMGVTKQYVYQIYRQSLPVIQRYLNSPIPDHLSNIPLPEEVMPKIRPGGKLTDSMIHFFGSSITSPEQLEGILDHLVQDKFLHPRDKGIIIDRLGIGDEEPQTYKQLATKWNIPPTVVQGSVNRTVKVVKQYLGGETLPRNTRRRRLRNPEFIPEPPVNPMSSITKFFGELIGSPEELKDLLVRLVNRGYLHSRDKNITIDHLGIDRETPQTYKQLIMEYQLPLSTIQGSFQRTVKLIKQWVRGEILPYNAGRRKLRVRPDKKHTYPYQ